MKLSNLLKNITNRLGYSGKKALILGVMGLFCAGVWGRNLTWNGGSILNDNWNNGANWGGIYSPEKSDDTANIKTAATINLNQNVSFKDLNVTSSGVSINTNGKTFTPTGTATITTGSDLTFTGTGSANLQNLVLGDNANLTVSGGTVSVGNITAGNGSKINISGGTVKLTQTLPGSPLDDTALNNLFNVTGGTIDLSGYPGDKTAIISWAAAKGIALAGVDYSLATVSKSASGITIKITRSSNASAETFPFTVNNYSAQTLTYSVDGGTSSTLPATGSFSIAAGTDSSTIDITPSAAFANGEGFEIIVTKPDNSALGTVDFFNGPVWIGTSTDGNAISNWKGVTAVSDLESADVYINTAANYPAFTADITLGSLHITSGTSVTNGTGTLTVAGDIENNGTLTCGAGNLTVQGEYSGSGSFTASSGTTTFLGNTDFSSATAFDANSGTINFFNKAAATGTNITFTTKSGQAFNDVYFGGDVTFSLTGTCTSNNFIQKGPSSEYYLSYNHNATITGSGSLSTGILEIYRVSSTDGVTGTLTLDADVTCTGNYTRLHSGGNLTINSGKKLTTVTLDRTGAAPLQKSTLTNNGTITVSNKVDFYNVDEIANNGTIEASGTTVSGVFSGTGTLKIKDSASTTTLTALAASTQKEIVLENSNVTISGDFSVTDFTATSNMSGKTITLSTSKIAVTGTLALKGATGTGNELSISGTTGDGFVLDADKTGGDYLKVDSNIALYSASGTPVTYTKAGYSYTAANSVPSAGITDANYVAVIKNGWDIKDKKLLTYKWKADAASADWTDAANWDIGLVPVDDATIEIQAVTTGTAPSISAAAVGGNITIDTGASLTFSSTGNLVLSGKAGNIAAAKTVTNNGTIVYQSTGRITDSTNVLNDNTAGTVEYNTGSGAISEIDTTLDYYTLKISSGTWSCAASINAVNLNITGGSISGTFTATTGISTSNTVTISDDTTLTGTTTNTGEIAFVSDKTLTIDGSFDDSGSTSATTGALKFTGTGTFTPNTSTSYSSIEIDATKITTAGNFTTGSLTITAGELDTNDEITITGNFSDSGTFTAGTSSNIILYGTSDQEFVPNASNTYEKITVNKSAGTVSFNTNALNVKTISDATSAGNISFNAGGTISSNTTFATTGDVTFAGSTVLSFGANTAEHTAGRTVLKGNVTASTLTVGAVSFEASSTITGNLSFSGGASDAGRKSLDDSSSHTLTIKNGSLTINGFYSIGATKNQTITLDPATGTITNNGNLTIPHSSSLTGVFTNETTGTITIGGTTVTQTGKLTNKGTISLTNGKSLALKNDFDDAAGTITGNGTISFTGTTDQIFTPNSSTPTTYVNITENKTSGKLTIDAALTVTNLTLTAGTQTDFSAAPTITNYSDTAAAGAVNFNAGGTIKSATEMLTTGTVTIPASQTLSISDGAASPAYYNYTHTAGTTAVNGELKAAVVTLGATNLSGKITASGTAKLGAVTVSGASASVTGTSVTTTTITATAATDEVTLTSTSGSFTTGQIGDSTTSFNKVTFDAGTSADLTFANKTLYTTTLDLKVDDSKKLILEGNLNITGTNGFVAPLKTDSTPIPVELSDATTITTSGPVTLYDNITGAKDLTITNAGVFTLNESSTPADPANVTSAPATSAAVGIFTQNGTGTVTLAGDISATGNISFATAITLSDNVKIATSSGSIDFNDGITGSHLLITSATDSTNFKSASTANINPTSVDVINGKLTVSTGKIIFNCPVTAEGDFINNTNTETVTHSTLTVKGNFTDSGTFTENTNSEIILSGTTDQNFVPGIVSGAPTTYKKITVNKSAGTASFITNSLNADYITLTLCDGATFNKPVSMTNGSANLTITNCGTNGTVFKDSVTLNKLTDASTAGNITFEAGGTISSATTFATTGTVQFGDDAADSITFGANSVTHTAGNTKIAGTLSASEVTAGKLTLLAASTINTTTTNGLKLSGGADADNKNSLTGSFTLTSGGNVSASAFYEINTTKITFFPVTKTLTNNGDLYLASTTITGEISNTDKLIISNDTTLKGSLTNNGTFEIAANKTFQLSTNFTNNGTITANSGSTFEIIDNTKNSAISGTAFAVQNFKADNLGDKTITLKTDVTVNGTLTLKGTDETHLLTIADDQTANANGKGFILSASQPSSISDAAIGDYLSIDDTVKIKKADGTSDGIAGFFYKASNSVPSGTYANAAATNAAYATVINNGWRIKDLSTLTYTWVGGAAATATDWATRAHWDIGIVPGVTTAGAAQSSGATVIIPDGKTSYPELSTTAYTLSSLTIGTNGAATHNASVTFGGSADLTVTTKNAAGTVINGSLANHSQIIYSSSGRIKGASTVINDSAKGSVEYKTNSNGTISDVEYFDLKITSGSWSKADALTVKHGLAISGGSSTFNGTVTVTNGFTVSGTPTLAINAGLTCTNSTISIPAGVTLSLGGTINSGTNIQTYTPAVTLSANADFQSSTITFGSTINATTAGTETLKVSGNGVFNGIIGGTKAPKTIEVTGTSTVNTSVINSTDNQTYTKAVTIGEQNTTFSSASGLVKFSSTLTGTPTVVAGPPASTTYYDITIDGNADLDGNVSKFDDFKVTGTTDLATSKTISANTTELTGAVTMAASSVITVVATNTFSNTVTIGNNSKIATTGAVNPMSSFAADISASGNDITLDTPVTVTNNISLTAAKVSFRNNISGTGKTLTLTANTSFSNASEITANILNKGTINVPAIADIAGVKQTAIAFKGNYTANDTPAGSLLGSTTENPYIDFYKDALFGTFTANGDTVRFMDTTAKAFNPNNQTFADLIFDNGTTTISENITADNLTININGKVTATDNKTITINKNWTNNATTADFTANESTVIFQSANQSSISGDNKFYNLSCTTSDKVIVFEAGKTQEVSHALTLTGTANHLITLKSSVPHIPAPSQWKIKCTGANVNNSISYVDVQDSNNTSAYRLNATYSKDSGNNDLWNFAGQAYTWTGAAASNNTDWFNKDNWNIQSVPGIGAVVTIPDTPNKPVLEHELEDQTSNTQYASIGSTGTLTVEANAELDLKAFGLTAKSITNSGCIRLSGSQIIAGETNNSRPTFTNNPDSKVVYYGTLRSDRKAAMGTSYAQLEFITGATGGISEDITVSQTTLIANGTGNNLTLSGSNTFTGLVTIGQPAVTGGPLSITSSADVTISGNANCDELTLIASNKTVKFLGALTTVNSTVISADNVTMNGDLTAGTSDITITAQTKATFSGNITTGTDLFVSTPLAVVNGSITAGTSGDITFNLNNGVINFTGADTSVSGNKLSMLNGDCKISKTTDINISNFTLPVALTGNLQIIKGKAHFTDISTASLIVSGDISNQISCELIFNGTSSCTNLTNNGTLSTSLAAPLSIAADFINTGDCYNSAEISINGNLTTSGTITADDDITVKGNLVNTGSTTDAITNNAKITIQGNLTDTNGKWKEGTGIIVFNGADDQTFNPNPSTVYYNVKEDKSSGLFTVTSNFMAENLKISSGVNSTFEASVDIKTYSDEINAGNITFLGGGIIKSDTTFLSTGTVQFGKAFQNPEESSSIMNFASATADEYYDISHVKGPTIIYGTLNASEVDFALLDCRSNITINCSTIDLSGNVNTTASYLKINGNLTTTNAITIYPNLMLNGSFEGTGQAILDRSLYIFNEDNPYISPSPVNIKAVTVQGDLIIDSQRPITTFSTIKADNFVLYKGAVTAARNSSITATRDIIILGTNYDINNTESGNNREFIYQQTRLSPYNYGRQNFASTNQNEDKMPDGKQLSTVATGFNGTYTSESNTILKAGKNFYTNGANFTGTGNWFIDLPDITNALNGFAEAVNTEVKFSTIRCYTDNSADGSKARMPAYFCTDNGDNQYWIFDDFVISEAQTQRDDSIRITFNHPVRNSNSELINSISRFTNSNNTYTGFFNDADCQNPLEEENINSSIIYIQAPDSWNTDATGKSSGTSTSTDRSGIHKEIIPYLQITALTTNSPTHISDIWGKRLINYDNSQRFTDVTDHTGPVLYSVRTGQEMHTQYNSSTGALSQPSYDAHNFIEFRYSEKVNFGDTGILNADNINSAIFDNSNTASTIWLPAAASTMINNFANIDNVRVRQSFGILENDITAQGQLIINGLGTIASGLIHTGKTGKTDKTVNALYRTDPYSIRLSIAGYTEDTVTDRNGDIYKKWIGYIESAQQPSGTVTMNEALNAKVTDCALGLDNSTPLYNPQERYKANQVVPTINQRYSDNTDYLNSGVYGRWDISEPVFAPLRMSALNSDNTLTWGNKDFYEAVGNTSGSGSTLDKIEFHFFDNTPDYDSSDEAAWLTEKGWCYNLNSRATELYTNYSYCADIIGGSRQFNTDASQRTTGGLRYSSIHTAAQAFKYIDSQTSMSVPSKNFDTTEQGVYPGAKASLFIGSATVRRAADNPDGLYFGLGLPEKGLPVTKSFTISYNEENGYITDLAGNRLRSATIKSIDRTPPSYNISFSPLNQKEAYVVFVKKLVSTSSSLRYRNNNGDNKEITEKFERLIPKCFELISIDSTGNGIVSTDNQIDYSVPARIENITSNRNGQEFTVIRLTLKKSVTLNAVENLYIRVKIPEGYDEYTQDPITGITNSRVSFIQDSIGNYMQIYEAHTLSDFAISSINPLYAYDQDMTYNNETIMNGLYEEGSWAVHDWNEDQQNYGTLPANHPYGIVADIDTGSNQADDLPAGVRIFLSANPDSDSVAKQYNSDLNKNLRIWLPEVRNGIIQSFSLTNNSISRFFQTDAKPLNEDDSPSRIQFDIPQEVTQEWGANQQISFLFGILNADGSPLRIYTSPYYDVTTGKYNLSKSSAVPLYSVRLKNPDDITSLDLWSFKTRGITEQRGGVTILNNAINATNGEKTVIKVNMPSAGKLNVMVMTLDGSIVTYLNHGQTEAGEHYYSWNGKNNNNGIVARGMYFIRVIGNGIDETRKVMVVK